MRLCTRFCLAQRRRAGWAEDSDVWRLLYFEKSRVIAGLRR